MTTKTLLSLGECMAELQLNSEGHCSLAFGGDTLNTAWYVRALTHPRDVAVEYYTTVGCDPLSKQMMEFFRDHNVGTQFVSEIAERNVGLYLISLTGAERSFTYWRGTSAARLLAEDGKKLAAALSKADVIYFSGITLAILEPEHRQDFLKVMQDVKGGGATVAFDSNLRRRLWPSDQAMKEATLAGYGVATVALPTFGDDQALFGDESPAKCAERIARIGVAEVIVKDGGKPTHLFVDGKLSKVMPEQVVGIMDTTGAGDSFNAGYLAARMANSNSVDAVKLAHKVAGRVIRGRGALLDMKGFSDLRVTCSKIT